MVAVVFKGTYDLATSLTGEAARFCASSASALICAMRLSESAICFWVASNLVRNAATFCSSVSNATLATKPSATSGFRSSSFATAFASSCSYIASNSVLLALYSLVAAISSADAFETAAFGFATATVGLGVAVASVLAVCAFTNADAVKTITKNSAMWVVLVMLCFT